MREPNIFIIRLKKDVYLSRIKTLFGSMHYNWQQNDWPNFTYDLVPIEDSLLVYLAKTARLQGMLLALPEALRGDMVVDLMTMEALKTSAIEGEHISREDVKSSIRNNLGLNAAPEIVHDLRAKGLGQMMTAARRIFSEKLTAEHLFDWHRLLLSYREDLGSIGAWRQHAEPMQVVSGAMGKERVHFEAPPSATVPGMMAAFIEWFNQTAPVQAGDHKFPPVRAALAHLWFESIHPFEDGNGRIGRAVAEKALSQGLGAPVPFSLSQAIEADKKAYYHALEQAQRSNRLTAWLQYFVPATLLALEKSEAEIVFTVQKAKYFDRFRDAFNERQTKAIRRMFEAGPEGFQGGMNARKYSGITGASKATATRDLQQLQQIGALAASGGGRSTRYALQLAL